jgi:hypothetical protein
MGPISLFVGLCSLERTFDQEIYLALQYLHNL